MALETLAQSLKGILLPTGIAQTSNRASQKGTSKIVKAMDTICALNVKSDGLYLDTKTRFNHTTTMLFSVLNFLKHLTTAEWAGIVLALCILTLIVIVWRSTTSHSRVARKVSAFRQEVWEDHHHLYRLLPHFDRMVELTLTGKPLTIRDYFTIEQVASVEDPEDLVLCRQCQSIDLILNHEAAECQNCGYRWYT